MNFSKIVLAAALLFASQSFAQSSTTEPTTTPPTQPNGGAAANPRWEAHKARMHACVVTTLSQLNPPVTFEAATQAQRKAAHEECHAKFKLARESHQQNGG